MRGVNLAKIKKIFLKKAKKTFPSFSEEYYLKKRLNEGG